MTQRSLFVLIGDVSGDVEDEPIGDAVRVVRLTDATRQAIYDQNRMRVANWDLFYGGNTHAVLNQYDSATKSDEEAEQEIVRAFLLLRIVRPTRLSLHLVVKATEAEGPGDNPQYELESRVGLFTATYVSEDYMLSRDDIRQTRPMWPNIQKVCQQWKRYQRVLQAMRNFEVGCANIEGYIRHILFYSALEYLLCTHGEYLGQQVMSRVMAIHPEVSKKQIRDISGLRGSLVHSGSITGDREQTEQARESALLLERILRATLHYVLSDKNRLEIFSDKERLKKEYPVTVKKVKHIPMEEEILI